jgi:hypothetical protein
VYLILHQEQRPWELEVQKEELLHERVEAMMHEIEEDVASSKRGRVELVGW